MAHLISIRENGFIEAARLAGTPEFWHGLSNEVPENSPLEIWLEKAGMDWKIEAAPVLFNDDFGISEFNDKKVLYRSDNKKGLSVVSKTYKIVQPTQILEFFRDLIDNNGLKLSTAGVLREGKMFWALAQTNESFEVFPGDSTDNYILLTTSADGSLSTVATITTTRVCCANTLNLALKSSEKLFKTSHRSVWDGTKVKLEMGLVSEAFYNYQKTIKKLSEVDLTPKFAKSFIYDLVSVPNVEVQEQPYTTDKMLKDIFHKVYNGIGNNGTTLYSLLNGITEYNTHSTAGRSFDAKFHNQFFGKNSNLSLKAYSKLEKMVA